MSRFLTLISTLRGGQARYLPLLLAKLSEVLPNLPLPRSLNVPQNIPTSMGLPAHGPGTVPSNVVDGFSTLPAMTTPAYPSNELVRRIAAQTGAQLPFNTSQQSMMPVPTSHVEDLSLYSSSHGTSHSSGSDHRSNSATPGPYEPPMSQSHSQIIGHPPVQLPSSHSTHGHMNHHVGVNPTAYDPRFTVSGYPVDPTMMFKQ